MLRFGWQSGFKLDFLFQVYATRTCTTLHCAWQDTASEDLGPWRAPETEPQQEDAGSSLGCGLKRIGQVEKCQNYSNLTSGYRHPRCKSRSCGSSSLLGATGCLGKDLQSWVWCRNIKPEVPFQVGSSIGFMHQSYLELLVLWSLLGVVSKGGI